MFRQIIQTISRGQQRTLIGLISVYRICISPFFGQCCRFYPSCSAYAQGAIKQRGCLKGCWLAAWRILKCNPLHPGGYDPVPSQTKLEAKPPSRSPYSRV